MKVFVVLGFLLLSSLAHANISCFVENPCAWLNPVPGDENNVSLGYCVDSVSGNKNLLTVVRKDIDGNFLKPYVIKVQEISSDIIYAKSEKAELKVTPYDDFFAGTLEMLEHKVGFFITCTLDP